MRELIDYFIICDIHSFWFKFKTLYSFFVVVRDFELVSSPEGGYFAAAPNFGLKLFGTSLRPIYKIFINK